MAAAVAVAACGAGVRLGTITAPRARFFLLNESRTGAAGFHGARSKRTMSAVLTNIMPFPDTLDGLVHSYIDAKRAEDAAKSARIEIEERILALTPAKPEGATTIEAAGFKVTLTGSLSYKADDLDAVREITRTWDTNLVPIKTKSELDATGCRYLKRERPELWAQLARAVMTTPAKTSVRVAL